jgi:formamidopyrimidine-DNA glycosylase
MPELPEVETIKLGLSRKIIGKTITTVNIYNKKSFQGNKKLVEKKKVLAVERRAKVIRLTLENNKNLLFHLKMTGQLIYIEKNNKRFAGGHPSSDWQDNLPNKYTRIEFSFNKGTKLFFNDLRKFGWCKVISNQEVEKEFSRYGPEPFSKDLNTNYLSRKAQKIPNRTIKQFLTDQEIVAGLGNIYNDETLFLSKIHPKTKVSKLNKNDWQVIINNALKILKKSIKYGGTTDSNYVDAEGKSGGMQDYLNVYHRTDKLCKNKCGSKIKRIKIGGRGTYYCPKCQKEKK